MLHHRPWPQSARISRPDSRPCRSEHAPGSVFPSASLPALLDSGRPSDGCKANINIRTSALGELWESSPLKYNHLLRGCNSQTCRTFPVTVMFPSASRLQAHMVEASVTSAVNMTLFGHTEDSRALEIEPFFPSPCRKGGFLQPHRNCTLTRPAAT